MDSSESAEGRLPRQGREATGSSERCRQRSQRAASFAAVTSGFEGGNKVVAVLK